MIQAVVAGKATAAPERVTSDWQKVPSKTRRPWLIIGGFVGGVLVTCLVTWLVVSTQRGNTKSTESIAMNRSCSRTGPTPLERPPEVMPPAPSVATERGTERQEQPSQRPALSLATGTWIMEPRGRKGDGVLKLRNGTGLDAVVKLVSLHKPREVFWVVYIKAHGAETVDRIGPGVYLLRFGLGLDWDIEGQKFVRNDVFYEAGEQLVFTETEPTEYRAGKYTELDITLHEVVGGNLRRVGISEAEFNEGTPADLSQF